MPRFQDIPQFTSFSGYSVHVGWDYLARNVARHVLDYNLNMEPDFQRGYVWRPEQKVKYVEYILQGGHSGRDVWFNCPNWQGLGEIGEYVLVDGKQRIEAVLGFLNNDFTIFGGNYFRDYTDRLRITHMNFVWNVNSLKTRDQCLQWYVDLNRGGTVHSDDEINRVRALVGQGGWVQPTAEEIRKYAGFDKTVIQAAIAELEAEDQKRDENARVQEAARAAKRGKKSKR
jgi:hypothetical protein